MLLDAAIAEWRLRGGHQVELEVSYDRTVARRLYEAAGFVDQGKYFEIGPIRTRDIPPGAGVEIRQIVRHRRRLRRHHAPARRAGPARSERGEAPGACAAPMHQHVSRTDTGSMLALVDGTPVGFVSLEFRQPFFTLQPQAWIPDLIVTESARGRDIGAALLDAAFVEAQRRNAYSVALESGHHRAVAHRLYAAAGMADVGSFFTLDALNDASPVRNRALPVECAPCA